MVSLSNHAGFAAFAFHVGCSRFSGYVFRGRAAGADNVIRVRRSATRNPRPRRPGGVRATFSTGSRWHSHCESHSAGCGLPISDYEFRFVIRRWQSAVRNPAFESLRPP